MLKKLIRILGPGILFASMAIGTSHLVLSTKAGAQYGWVMIIPIVLANLFKYPFFEFGARYTYVTQKTLISGYQNQGKGYLWLYAGITIVSIFTLLAALYVVTSGLLINWLKLTGVSLNLVSLGLFLLISIILILGKYDFLELSLKVVVSLLFVALVTTTIMVIVKGQTNPVKNFEPPAIFNETGILFLISLMGWMPTAVEASAWVSMWSIEKLKKSIEVPSLKTALQEFNLGYMVTSLLALFFLTIGTMTLYGSGTALSGNSVTFADQVINLFTSHIGNWAYFLIAIAAFATMFSTCMTAHDAIARVGLDIIEKLYPGNRVVKQQSSFALMVLLLTLINWVVIAVFRANMGTLIALATFVSFVFAPILGWMNYKTVTGKDVPKEYQPKKWMKTLAYLGMLFLSAFALYYCWVSFL